MNVQPLPVHPTVGIATNLYGALAGPDSTIRSANGETVMAMMVQQQTEEDSAVIAREIRRRGIPIGPVAVPIYSQNENASSAGADEKKIDDKKTEDEKTTVNDDGSVCFLCFDIMRAAQVLTCGHALCGSCYDMLYQNDVGTTRCPCCRAQINKNDTIRCYALDKAIEALHPLEKKNAVAPRPPAKSRTADDICRMQALRMIDAVDQAVDLVISLIEDEPCNSSSFLLSENEIPAAFRATGLRSGDDWTDKRVKSIWESIWGLYEEIADCLKNKGFEVKLFRRQKGRCILIEW